MARGSCQESLLTAAGWSGAALLPPTHVLEDISQEAVHIGWSRIQAARVQRPLLRVNVSGSKADRAELVTISSPGKVDPGVVLAKLMPQVARSHWCLRLRDCWIGLMLDLTVLSNFSFVLPLLTAFAYYT